MVECLLTAQQQQARDAALQQLAADRSASRLWQRDASLWYPAPDTQARIRERLGWLDLPDIPMITSALASLRTAIEQRRTQQIVYVVPGIVGRAARLWWSLAADQSHAPSTLLVDSADPHTVEQALVFRDRAPTFTVHAGAFDTPQAQALGAALPADLLVPLPPRVGDRFGTLAAPAVLPAALHGWDWQAALEPLGGGGAHAAPSADDQHLHLGATLGALAQAGHDLLHIAAPPPLEPLAHWLAAFVAGALGKHRRGFVPVVGALPMSTGYAQSVVVQLAGEEPPAAAAALTDLQHAGVPIIRCPTNNDTDIAALVRTWQLAVAVAAMVIGVNPFDAPDADAINARIVQQLPAQPPAPATSGDWPQIAARARFLAIAAYLPPVDDEQLAQIRLSLSAALVLPVLLVFPLRDWAWTLQLLHAGRPGGVMLAISADALPAADPRVVPLAMLERTQLGVEADTWQRMGQQFGHRRLPHDASFDLARWLR